MNLIVIDASITLSWIFQDEATPFSESVLRSLNHSRAIAPSHWLLELVNVLAMSERRGRSTSADTATAMKLVQALPVVIDGQTSKYVWSDTLDLARTYRLTLYDAAYLELALRHRIPLATLDRELVAACPLAGGTLV